MRRPRRDLALAFILCTGVIVAPAGAVSTRASAAPARITFYFGLVRPEAAAGRAFFAVEQPGSPSYRRFLSARAVANRFGASAATRAAFLRAARRLGLTARIDSSHVFARMSGTVAQFERAFHARIDSAFGNYPNVRTWFVHGHRRLMLPRSLRGLVREVVATYAHSANAMGVVTAGSRRPPRWSGIPSPAPALARAPRRTGTWTRGCAAARRTGGFSFGQVRHAYGIDRLGTGAAASVAVLNVGEGVSRKDIADNARCFGYPPLRSRTLLSDGQTRSFGYGTFEPEEDLALVRGMAPALRSLTFTQVWLSPELWFLGAANVLDAPHLPDSLSISYAECERSIRGSGAPPSTRAGADLLDAVFVRLGLAGVGSYASAGDSGSTCDGLPRAGVAWPSSSPFVTAVGGTYLTLDRANVRSTETVWNDLRWLSSSQGGGAGGGGYSAVSARPPFQRGLGIPGSTRTTPDVSAAASAFPGWPVVLAGNWITDAGTSASSPLVATAMALASADERRAHRPPIGPADGLLYSQARARPRSVWDVVKGANGYKRGIPGHRATPGYDLASGLGVPRFESLLAALPRPS